MKKNVFLKIIAFTLALMLGCAAPFAVLAEESADSSDVSADSSDVDTSTDESSVSDTSSEASYDVSDDISDEVSSDVSVDVSDDVSVDVSDDVSVDVSDDVSDDVSADISVDVSDDVSSDASVDVSDDVSGDESSDVSTPVEKEFVLEVEKPAIGDFTVNDGISGTADGNAVTYVLKGIDSVTVTVKYIPAGGETLKGIFAGASYYTSEDGSVTFEITQDTKVSFEIAYEQVNAPLVFKGSDDTKDIVVKLNGDTFTGGQYPKGISLTLTLELPEGLRGEKAELVFADGETETITVNIVSNSCTLPAVDKDFTLNITIAGRAIVHINVTSEGEGEAKSNVTMTQKGQQVTFTAVPAEGYYIERATLNGNPVTMTNGEFKAAATSDLNFHVVFGKIPDALKVTLSVSEDGSNGTVAFKNFEGPEAEIPYGTDCEIVFNPQEGYVLDTVYINGIATTVTDNKLVINVKENYEIIALFKVATYKITAMVNNAYGGKITAEGYDIVNHMATVEHGQSITFKFTPDMGHLLASVKVDGRVLSDLKAEYTFENVTANHTITVSFVADGVDVETNTVTVDRMENGSVMPNTTVTVNKGDDVTLTFIPDEGYELDKVYLDGKEYELTQAEREKNQLVLISVNADHIVKVTFKKLPTVQKEWITADAIDWEVSEIIIDISSNTKVGKDVFEKIATLGEGKTVIFRTNLFDVKLPVNAVVNVDGEYADLAYSTDKDDKLDGCIKENNITSAYTVITLSSYIPEGAEVTLKLGSEFVKRVVDVFVFDGTALNKKQSGITVEDSKLITFAVDEAKTFVVAIDGSVPLKYTVNINCGSNGTADPTSKVSVESGSSLTIRILPFAGYMVDKITVNGNELVLDEEARKNGDCELPLNDIKCDVNVDITFTLIPVEEESQAGLIVLIVIISVAFVGGGALFFVRWKMKRF